MSGFFRATPLYTTLFSVDYNLYQLRFLFILSLAEIPVLPGLGCLSVDLSVSTRRVFVHFFFRFFNAGFPDFRLPRAAEQGGAPRLPAEEAATPGACAPAPANSACARAPASSASLGLERMLTEMRLDVWTGREGRHKRKGWKTKNGLGEEKQRVGVGSGVGGQDPVGSCGRVYAMVQWLEETKYTTGCVRTYGCVEEQWGR